MFPMVAHTGSVTHETLNWAATGLSQTEIKMAWNHAVLTPRILRLPQDSGSNDSDKLWKVNDWISWPGHMLSQLIPVSSFKRRQQQQQKKTKKPMDKPEGGTAHMRIQQTAQVMVGHH